MVSQATRKEAIELLAQGYDLVRAALGAVPQEAISFKPGPEKWSVHEVIVHLADSEANGFVRLRKIIAENGSAITVYDQDLWAQELHYVSTDMNSALELFKALREANTKLLKSTSEIVWATHAVNHPERGSFTLDDWLRTYSNHVPNHVKQIERNMEAWKKKAAQ